MCKERCYIYIYNCIYILYNTLVNCTVCTIYFVQNDTYVCALYTIKYTICTTYPSFLMNKKLALIIFQFCNKKMIHSGNFCNSSALSICPLPLPIPHLIPSLHLLLYISFSYTPLFTSTSTSTSYSTYIYTYILLFIYLPYLSINLLISQ